MSDSKFITPLQRQAACIGSGLVTLDIVIEAQIPDQYIVRAGGSCGNVMAILAYLGWNSYPVARLGQDSAAGIVLSDLAGYGVDTRFVRQESLGSTPSIIEGISNSKNGHRRHSYRLYCPHCGNYLLRYRAISGEMTKQVLAELSRPEVFYFDRTSRGALQLARTYRKQGALIVFEPSGVGEIKLFIEATKLSHILKYSHERFSDTSELLEDIVVPLEVQTIGRAGLRYRRQRDKSTGPWEYMPAFKVNHIADEAGAGDWCTSGIIHSLGRYGARSFWGTREAGLERALQLGQALAAVSCQFTSARGAMYSNALPQLDALVQELAKGQMVSSEVDFRLHGVLDELIRKVCSRCSQLNQSQGEMRRKMG